MSVARRLLSGVTLSSSGCWLWNKSTDGRYYGKIKVNGKMEYVHRVSYSTFVGDIPKGLEIDHLCKVKLCLNPRHLEAVTHSENLLRADLKTAVCKRGHERSQDNMRRSRRACRICENMMQRRRRNSGAVDYNKPVLG